MVSPSQRHALLYATQFFAFGVMLPFLPAVLAGRGLDPNEVAIVLSAGSAVRLIAGPAGGRVADALAAPKAVLVACAVISGLACMGFLVGAGFVAMLAVHAVLSSAMAPLMPLAWPSRRVMARCVLPVLVGPSTARTRAGRPPEGNPDMA